MGFVIKVGKIPVKGIGPWVSGNIDGDPWGKLGSSFTNEKFLFLRNKQN